MGVVAMLIGFLCYPVTAAIPRLGGRRTRPPMRCAARLLVAAGVLTIARMAYFLPSIVQAGATQIGPTILDRPPAGLLRQLAAVSAIVAAAPILARYLRKRLSAGPLVTPLASAALFLGRASYWDLFTVVEQSHERWSRPAVDRWQQSTRILRHTVMDRRAVPEIDRSD
ncbi:hypothetical protein GCM10009765_82040 [Fodinicola feengrottensis]|uniref:Uncharacterized protein n=2 Tax=Fodinicola feengrottensis TaxID=435914 RepID=A0ABN2JAR5_9ACTN